MSAHKAAENVEKIVKRRAKIIELIERRQNHIDYTKTHPGSCSMQSGARYNDIPVKTDFFVSELERQIKELDKELDGINKKLEAIDAIMGG